VGREGPDGGPQVENPSISSGPDAPLQPMDVSGESGEPELNTPPPDPVLRAA
jgi:hypothetical protein